MRAKLLGTFVLLSISLHTLAQPTGFREIVGDGFGFTKFSDLYGYGTYSTEMDPDNLYGDSFQTSNWHYRMSVYSDEGFFEFDGTAAMYAMIGGMYAYIANQSPKPTHLPGVGELRQINDNLADYKNGGGELVVHGYDVNFMSMDFSKGKGPFTFGAYIGIHGIGVVKSGNDFSALNYQEKFSSPNTVNFWALGLGPSWVKMDSDLSFIAGFRVNYLSGWKKNHYYEFEDNRNGFEVNPSLRLFLGDEAGIFVELSARFRKFLEFETTDIWSYDYEMNNGSSNYEPKTGTIPEFDNFNFSVVTGFYF